MRNLLQICVLVLVGMACQFLCGQEALAQIEGGMLDPDLDKAGEPFSYFWRPNEVLGALYAPVASEVTPEGNIWTGFGELMFYVGKPLVPVNQRMRTLLEGYLPVVQYKVTHRGVQYAFTMFASDLGAALEGLPVNFVQVEMTNKSQEQRAAFLASAFRVRAPYEIRTYRFGQRFDRIPGRYMDGQTKYNPDWKYSLGRDALLRDGRILYIFPETPQPHETSLSLLDKGLRMHRYFSGEIEGNPDPKLVFEPEAPLGLVQYRVLLKPGEKSSLVFKMPVVPLSQDSPEAGQVRQARYVQELQKTVSDWKRLVPETAPLRFPERKVQEYLLANTIYDLLAIDKVGEDYVPIVNKFQYHKFYGGSDTAHMLMGLNYMGLQDIARRGFLYSRTVQASDGAFVGSNSVENPENYNYYETFGFSLWGWGRHYLLTRDREFLEKVYPGVVKGVEWEMEMTRKDPAGLMPPSTIGDDAQLANCRTTGQNIWVLVGLRNAIVLARAMGREQDVRAFEAEYQRYWNAFEKLLNAQTAKSGGYIPPALERTLLGNNWDNLLTLYPEPLFEPFDPRVTATIRKSRETYSEGILGYVVPRAVARNGAEYVFDATRRLHYWHTPDNTQNALVRGSVEDQEAAVKDLYALLLHTSAAHAPQEFGTIPWSTRDIWPGNLLPDGPASGKTIEVLRNMLVRESGNDLYLFSAVSPAWLKAGKNLEAVNQPTTFGSVSVSLRSDADGFTVKLSSRFVEDPKRIIIRVPWFYQVRQVEADGRPVTPANGELALGAGVREVRVKGTIKPGSPDLSYESVVQDYKREYRRRYQEFLRTGVTQP